jgi:hypothetical protein
MERLQVIFSGFSYDLENKTEKHDPTVFFIKNRRKMAKIIFFKLIMRYLCRIENLSKNRFAFIVADVKKK